MSVLAHLEPIDKLTASRRGAPRFVLSLGSTLGPCGSAAVIHDLSSTGLSLETAANLDVGDTFQVELPHMGPAKATVIWRQGPLFGCQFEHSIARSAVSAALLRSEPPDGSRQQAQTGSGSGRQPSSGADPDELGQRRIPIALRFLPAIGIAMLVVGGWR